MTNRRCSKEFTAHGRGAVSNQTRKANAGRWKEKALEVERALGREMRNSDPAFFLLRDSCPRAPIVSLCRLLRQGRSAARNRAQSAIRDTARIAGHLFRLKSHIALQSFEHCCSAALVNA